MTQTPSRPIHTKPVPAPEVMISVNGVSLPGQPGEYVIDALNRFKTELPQVCYHHQLGPIQTCDTCIVEIGGQLVRACATPVQAGQVIRTEVAAARTAREEAYDRILGNHSLYCTVCDNNNGNCVVHNTVALIGVEHQNRPFQPKPYEIDNSNPFYRYDPDQCILCGRCVEACQNLQVNETLSIDWESANPVVLWDGGKPIGESSCVSCGHCVTVCPCNALQEKSMLHEAGMFTGIPLPMFNSAVAVVKNIEPSIGYTPILNLSEIESAGREGYIEKTKTVCTYCGVGCSFEVWTKDRHILKIEPTEGPANGVSTCVKGKFGFEYTNSVDRLTSPLIREASLDGTSRFREASWNEAIDLMASKMNEIRAEHGPDSLAFIASSKCTNEESYLMQKLARSVVGTNNIDNCSRYCQSPATQGLFRTVGYGGDSGTIRDIEAARLVMVIGANAAENHPVLATRVKRAHKLRGQQLVVVDLRENELATRADVFLRPNPSTDFVLVSALSRYILAQGLADQGFLDQWVNGLEEFRASVAEYTLERAEEITGIPVHDLESLALRLVAASDRAVEGGVCILWAMGITQQCGGSETSTAISNLLLLTGNYMRTGTGAYPLRGHNNVQGASDFGSMPNYLPGYQKVDDAEVIGRFEGLWGKGSVPTSKGLDNTEMVQAMHDDKLKFLYLKGEEMSLTDANATHVQEGYDHLDFFVVQDIIFSETAHYADLVLPASPSLEKDGTFTSTERRIQRLYTAIQPLEGSKPDWQIIQLVANALGAGWSYSHPGEIMAEAAALTPLFAGVTYERLEGFKSLCWPVNPDGSDTPLLYTEGFHFPDGKARLYPAEYLPRAEAPDEEFDLHLNTGRMLEHFHEGNMTFRTPGIEQKAPDTFVEISPELAAERGLESGRLVRLVSRHGAIRLRALVTDRVSGKEVFVPMNADDASKSVNYLTGDHKDRTTNTPAYKDHAVRLEVLPEMGINPLPRSNHRWGHPTPQNGVEVERKWARPDYVYPGDGLGLLQGASLNARVDKFGVGADD